MLHKFSLDGRFTSLQLPKLLKWLETCCYKAVMCIAIAVQLSFIKLLSIAICAMELSKFLERFVTYISRFGTRYGRLVDTASFASRGLECSVTRFSMYPTGPSDFFSNFSVSPSLVVKLFTVLLISLSFRKRCSASSSPSSNAWSDCLNSTLPATYLFLISASYLLLRSYKLVAPNAVLINSNTNQTLDETGKS